MAMGIHDVFYIHMCYKVKGVAYLFRRILESYYLIDRDLLSGVS